MNFDFTQTLRILIVEDEAVNSKLLQVMLSKSELAIDEVKSAESLADALALLQENDYDVVLLDLNLPDSRGMDTLISLSAKYPQAAIVVITGEYDDKIGLKAITTGAQEYLMKGRYDTYLLNKSIFYALERKQTAEKIKSLAKFPSEDPNPVLRISKDGEILYANEASSAILQAWQSKEGQRLPETQCRLIEKVLSSGKAFAFDLDCGERIFSVTMAPVAEFGYVNVYGLDITELRLSKEDLKRAREQAEMKSQFASTVSHELRTPLAAMKEGVNIVLEEMAGEINPTQRKFLNVAKRNIDRLGRLIDGVLDFQKLEAGKMSFDLRENDLNEVVREVYEAVAPAAESAKLGLFLELDESLDKVPFDSDKITQVLTNVVSNALKFTEKGRVTITTGRAENGVRVAVADTGSGIEQEDLPKIFDNFEQLGRDGERKTGGTGLGLAISKKIIEQHDGKIWAESKLGEGTTINFTLPVAALAGIS